MCDRACSYLESFSPEVEYQKFLRRKPVIHSAHLYEDLQERGKFNCSNNVGAYGIGKDNNIMYRTHNSEYGYYAPNIFTTPSRHFPLSQKFSYEQHRCGMYRNFSLNTHLDKTYY